jgi:hypothetical protein
VRAFTFNIREELHLKLKIAAARATSAGRLIAWLREACQQQVDHGAVFQKIRL